MKILVKTLSIITFTLASATIMSIFYEGMILKWLDFVGILIFATDILFLTATIAGIFYYKKHKILFYSHLISFLIIILGVVMSFIYKENIPKILFTLWEFYIVNPNKLCNSFIFNKIV